MIVLILCLTLWTRSSFQKTWKMSSSSSTMTIPTPLRITSTVLDAQLAVPTRALPTLSSPQGTCDRLETWSGCWQRPGRPLTLNCFSWWTHHVAGEEAEAGRVTVAATPTTLTSCIRTSVIGACVEAAIKMAAAASTVTIVTETAPLPRLPRTGIEAAIRGTATTPAQISTRATVAAGPSTLAAEARQVEVRISTASHRGCSLVSPLLLFLLLFHLHQGSHSLSWLSSLLHHSRHSWPSWGSLSTLLLPHHRLLQALHLPESSGSHALCVYIVTLFLFFSSCQLQKAENWYDIQCIYDYVRQGLIFCICFVPSLYKICWSKKGNLEFLPYAEEQHLSYISSVELHSLNWGIHLQNQVVDRLKTCWDWGLSGWNCLGQ